MDFSQVYFSFFFVGSFIAFAVTGAFAVFLLTLKNKSSATLHLGFSLGFLALFNMAYLIPYSIYHPLAAYHPEPLGLKGRLQSAPATGEIEHE